MKRNCKYCNQEFYTKSSKRKYCSDKCKYPNGLRKHKTKQEIFELSKNWQTARTLIRKNAQDIFEISGKLKACAVCGYDKHYEICHIKAVSEFDGHAYLNEINDPNNLIALCPNCHWEYDHNLLAIAG